MPVDRLKLKRAYARLLGIDRACPIVGHAPAEIGQDLNQVVIEAQAALDEDLSAFMLPQTSFIRGPHRNHVEVVSLRSKLHQLKSHLEHVYQISESIIQIGTLYNSIRDEELRSRCADLLSAPGAFDRVINQATLVLEDRIRSRSGVSGMTGAPLIGLVLKVDAANAVLRVSDDPDEHRGLCEIIRGIVSAFRNPTHHFVSERFTREEALQVCAFIDNLLRVIDRASVQSQA